MLKDHLNKLEYFCAIVENKSLLKASKSCFVSQPQLSKIIRQLEEELDCKLFTRLTTGVEVTPKGNKLYHFARKTLDDAGQLQLLIGQDKDIKGNVRIGTYDSISRYFFPSFLKYLKKSAPKLNLELVTGRTSKVLQMLKNDEIDFAVVVEFTPHTRGLQKKEIYTDSFGLYHNKQFNSDFQDYLIVFLEALGKNAEKENFNFKYIHHCDNLETVKSLTEQGLGIGLLPHRVAREGVLSGKLIQYSKNLNSKFKTKHFPHKIILVHKKKEKSNHILDLTLSEIERFLGAWVK